MLDDEFPITAQQIENLIVFVVNLMTESVQVKVAISVCHKILDLDEDRDDDDSFMFDERFMLKALTSLVIDVGTKAQLRELQILGEKIQCCAADRRIRFSQASIKKLTKFFDRVEIILSHLKDDANSSQLGMDEAADRTLRDETQRPSSRSSVRSDVTSNTDTGAAAPDDDDEEEEDADRTLIDYHNLSARSYTLPEESMDMDMQ